MKKVLIIFTMIIFLFANFTVVNAEAAPSLTEGVYILIESSSGEVLSEQNPNAKMYPASTTKIMTAILALELGEMDQIMTASQAAINDIGKDGSNIGIMAGEEMRMEDLLKALMISSANETANIIAENLCPTRQEFVDLMNKKAIELGALNTHFENPCGAHEDNHYTTPADLAKIAQYAMSFEDFREIAAMSYYSLPSTNKHVNPADLKSGEGNEGKGTNGESNIVEGTNGESNTNESNTGEGNSNEDKTAEGSTNGSIASDTRMKWPERLTTTNKLMQYDDGGNGYKIDGIKTGYTGPAGYCLVSSATNESGLQLISVVMGLKEYGSQSKIKEFSEDLLGFGYRNFKRFTIIDTNTVYRSVAVEDARDETPLHLVTDGIVSCILPVNSDMSNIQETPQIMEVISAPVNAGDIMGYVEFTKDGESIGKINLLASRSVDMKTQAVIKSKFLGFLKTPLVKRIIVGICMIIPAFILLRLTLRTISRRRNSKRF